MRGILVGMGGRAQSWIQVCGRHAEVELVAYAEPVDATRNGLAEKLGLPSARLFASIGQAIEAVDADFVLDVTPPAAHESVATQAFSAGLHVIGEKPLSDDFEAA
ncbi:MAG: Gfo/Idh/MocA family oxidoreductase [Planctomycetota bacterium]